MQIESHCSELRTYPRVAYILAVRGSHNGGKVFMYFNPGAQSITYGLKYKKYLCISMQVHVGDTFIPNALFYDLSLPPRTLPQRNRNM